MKLNGGKRMKQIYKILSLKSLILSIFILFMGTRFLLPVAIKAGSSPSRSIARMVGSSGGGRLLKRLFSECTKPIPMRPHLRWWMQRTSTFTLDLTVLSPTATMERSSGRGPLNPQKVSTGPPALRSPTRNFSFS